MHYFIPHCEIVHLSFINLAVLIICLGRKTHVLVKIRPLVFFLIETVNFSEMFSKHAY